MLLDALKNGLPKRVLSGLPTKKQRIDSGTPLKHYLRPIIEEAVRADTAPPMPQVSSNDQMVEAPSTNPLLNTLMAGNQGGMGGSMPSTPQPSEEGAM